MNTDDQTVPLQLLASEWDLSAEELITQLGADKVLTDVLGIRHVRAVDAAALHNRRNAEAQRHREADEARAAVMAKDFAAQQARLQAIQAQQAPLIAHDPSQPALAVMMGSDHDSRLEQAGRRFDEYLGMERRGEIGTMTRLTPQPPQEG
jgi:hypothetical protein